MQTAHLSGSDRVFPLLATMSTVVMQQFDCCTRNNCYGVENGMCVDALLEATIGCNSCGVVAVEQWSWELLVLSLAFGVAAVPLGVLLAYWVTRLQARTHAPSPSRKHRTPNERTPTIAFPRTQISKNNCSRQPPKRSKIWAKFSTKSWRKHFHKMQFWFSTETIIWLKTSNLFGEETQFSFDAFFLFSWTAWIFMTTETNSVLCSLSKVLRQRLQLLITFKYICIFRVNLMP